MKLSDFSKGSDKKTISDIQKKIGRPSTPSKCFDLGEIVAISKFSMVYFGDSEDTDLFRIHEEIAKTE